MLLKSKLIKILPFLLLLLPALIGNSNAQSQCPPGYMRIATGEGPASPCAPDPSYVQSQTPSAPAGPKLQWENRWGAIAQNEKSGPGIVGYSFDQTSKRKAKKVAIKDCESRGGRNCTAEFTYKNQCAAIVAGEKSYHLTSSDSLKESIEMGKNYCHDSGNKECEVRYTNCTKPVLVRI